MHKPAVYFIVFVLLTVPVLSYGTVVNPNNGHSYDYISAPPQISWLEARDSAEALGGYLVSINSASEQNFIFGLMPEGDSAWIGGMDAVYEGSWIWWSGESFGYQNWGVNQPDLQEGRDYLAIHQADNGAWRAVYGYGSSFIVEYNCCADDLAGNVDCDANDTINIFDATYLIDYLYKGGPKPCCLDKANINGDRNGTVNLFDISYLISYLYKGGGPLAPCGPTAGEVWSTDTVFAVDNVGKAWDVTHAVKFYGMNIDSLNFGIGQDAFPPVLSPLFLSPGDPGYPNPSDNFKVLGFNLGTEKRAYKLQTLIGHEVVDDQFGEFYFAATY